MKTVDHSGAVLKGIKRHICISVLKISMQKVQYFCQNCRSDVGTVFALSEDVEDVQFWASKALHDEKRFLASVEKGSSSVWVAAIMDAISG